MDARDRLKILINLAHSDGALAEQERQQIMAVGQANHLMVAEILPLFTTLDSTPKHKELTADQTADLLLEIVQLMRIDEKVYKAEIKYCIQVASKLGYREEVVFELMLHAKDIGLNDTDALHKIMTKFVKK